MASSWSQDMFRNALDHIADAVLISDCAGAVRFANRQARQLLGYSSDELLGQDLKRLMPECFRLSPAAQARPSTAGRGRPLAARRKDGTEFPARISFDSIEDAQGTFIVATIRDITADQRLYRDLPRVRDAAANAERAVRQARGALAATRRANAAQWTAACYLLRQQLHAVSLLNGLLTRGGRPDEVALTRALSNQVETIVTMMNLLDPPDHPGTLESHSAAVTTKTPAETVARPAESIRRNASRLRPPSTGARVRTVAQFTGTVLIVLRDRGMREAAAALLRISGYDVLTSRDAEEAHSIARLHPEVGYVLTEQAPGSAQTGTAMIDSLRSTLGASLKIILVSDDPLIAWQNRIDSGDFTRVAPMPVRAEELLRLMEDLRHEESFGSAKPPDSGERHAR